MPIKIYKSEFGADTFLGWITESKNEEGFLLQGELLKTYESKVINATDGDLGPT